MTMIVDASSECSVKVDTDGVYVSFTMTNLPLPVLKQIADVGPQISKVIIKALLEAAGINDYRINDGSANYVDSLKTLN